MKRISEFRIRITAVILAVSLSGCTADGKVSYDSKSPPDVVMAMFSDMDVVISNGDIPLIFTSGYDNRAFKVRSMLEEAAVFFEDELGSGFNYSLAILDPFHWKNATPVPYGFPHLSPDRLVIFLPATTDIPVTQDYISRKTAASQEILKTIESTGYSFEEAVHMMIDIIGFHELGHIYTHSGGIGMQTKWFNEFMANYLTCYYLQQKKPELAVIWENMAAMVVEGPLPAHTTIADFEEIYVGVGVPNYHWYQSMFIRKAAEIAENDGSRFFSDLQNILPGENEGPKLSGDELLTRLDSVRPGFRSWLAEFDTQTSQTGEAN